MATLGGIRHLSLARPHHLQLLRQLLHLHFQGFDILMNIHILPNTYPQNCKTLAKGIFQSSNILLDFLPLSAITSLSPSLYFEVQF